MTFSAASIANAFLTRAFASGAGITPMKIQKLLYLAQGYSLVIRNSALIDELFEAWRFGPVLPSLYQSCKKYGRGFITQLVEDFTYGQTGKNPAPLPNDYGIAEIISFVWENYASMDAIELSDWTHEKGGPWDTVIHRSGLSFKNQTIDNDLIKQYFTDRMSAGDDEKTPTP